MICDLVFFSLKGRVENQQPPNWTFQIDSYCAPLQGKEVEGNDVNGALCIKGYWPGMARTGGTYLDVKQSMWAVVWHSWSSGRFRNQIFVVRIQSSYFLFSVNCHEKIKINKNCAFKKQCSRPKSRLDFFLIHLSASMNSVRVFPL